jgi:DNA-directed RNA polymerase specialized sigma24 family protein
VEPVAIGSPQPLPQEEAESMEMADRFAAEFASAFRSLTPTRQALLSLVYGHGMGKADAGRVLGMRDYEVSRELGASIRSLRDRLDAVNPGTWTQSAAERWTRAWAAISESTEGATRHDA